MLIWAIWKVRKNMNADMKWLDNPEVFKVNQLEPHSDHCYYLDYPASSICPGTIILSNPDASNVSL